MTFQDAIDLAAKTAYPEPDSPIHSMIIPQVIDAFKKHLPPPATVLDIGCGSCFGAKLLREAGYDVTPASCLVDEVVHATTLGFNAALAEMHATDSIGKFDAVWLRHVAEHSPCPLFLLSKLAEQSRWLYIEVPLPGTSAMHETNPNHHSVLTAHGWAKIIRQSGWQIVESQDMRFTVECGDDAYIFFICKKP